MARPRYRRQSDDAPAHRAPEVPVVLPHGLVAVNTDGTMTVAVDGAAHEPPAFAPAWRREDFATVLDQLTEQRQSPLRVEVREADGSVFTDIITPGKRRRPEPATPEPAPPTVAPASPELVVLHGAGLVPGEDVAVAVVLAHTDAAPDGTARGLLSADQLTGTPTGEVVLLGRVSGTLTIGRPG